MAWVPLSEASVPDKDFSSAFEQPKQKQIKNKNKKFFIKFSFEGPL